jgi:hypothetical protein
MSIVSEANDGVKCGEFKEVIKIDEGKVRQHVEEVVRQSVEETLRANAGGRNWRATTQDSKVAVVNEVMSALPGKRKMRLKDATPGL